MRETMRGPGRAGQCAGGGTWRCRLGGSERARCHL